MWSERSFIKFSVTYFRENQRWNLFFTHQWELFNIIWFIIQQFVSETVNQVSYNCISASFFILMGFYYAMIKWMNTRVVSACWCWGWKMKIGAQVFRLGADKSLPIFKVKKYVQAFKIALTPAMQSIQTQSWTLFGQEKVDKRGLFVWINETLFFQFLRWVFGMESNLTSFGCVLEICLLN